MTRKDYILIAEVLQGEYKASKNRLMKLNRQGVIDTIAQVFAISLSQDNPRFDRAHFLSIVRGEKELTSKPQSKPSCCISDGCGRSFDPNMEETRPHETLRPFWMRYCHRHRVTGKLYPAIVEKTQ